MLVKKQWKLNLKPQQEQIIIIRVSTNLKKPPNEPKQAHAADVEKSGNLSASQYSSFLIMIRWEFGGRLLKTVTQREIPIYQVLTNCVWYFQIYVNFVVYIKNSLTLHVQHVSYTTFSFFLQAKTAK